jgi:hypothetical protein
LRLARFTVNRARQNKSNVHPHIGIHPTTHCATLSRSLAGYPRRQIQHTHYMFIRGSRVIGRRLSQVAVNGCTRGGFLTATSMRALEPCIRAINWLIRLWNQLPPHDLDCFSNASSAVIGPSGGPLRLAWSDFGFGPLASTTMYSAIVMLSPFTPPARPYTAPPTSTTVPAMSEPKTACKGRAIVNAPSRTLMSMELGEVAARLISRVLRKI